MSPRPSLLATIVVVAGCAGARPAPAPIGNVPAEDAAAAPRAPSCAGELAGDWLALVHREEEGKWDRVELRLTRSPSGALAGRIVVTTWSGDAAQAEPPRCDDGSPAVSEVVQEARGQVSGDRFELVGAAPRRTATPCGVPPTTTYRPDRFTGTIAGDRLDAVNDDGGVDQDRPHDFTRLACPDVR